MRSGMRKYANVVDLSAALKSSGPVDYAKGMATNSMSMGCHKHTDGQKSCRISLGNWKHCSMVPDKMDGSSESSEDLTCCSLLSWLESWPR